MQNTAPFPHTLTIALPDFSQLLAQFIQSHYSQFMLMLLYGSLNGTVNETNFWTIRRIWLQEKRKLVVLHCTAVGLC